MSWTIDRKGRRNAEDHGPRHPGNRDRGRTALKENSGREEDRLMLNTGNAPAIQKGKGALLIQSGEEGVRLLPRGDLRVREQDRPKTEERNRHRSARRSERRRGDAAMGL